MSGQRHNDGTDNRCRGVTSTGPSRIVTRGRGAGCMLAMFSVAASAVRSAAAVAWLYRSYGLASKCAEEACCCLPVRACFGLI